MKTTVIDKIKPVLDEIKEEFTKIFTVHIHKIILFGSYARLEAKSDSDIDILLILDEVDDLYSIRKKYINSMTQISLKYDTVITIIPMSKYDFENKKIALLLIVHKEGISL